MHEAINGFLTPTTFTEIAAVPSLYRAWRKVRANHGAAGIDAVSICMFEHGLEANLRELSRNLLDHTYEALPARYVQIAKRNGKERELAILAVRDRIAQRAVLDAVEPLFEPEFLDCSYAFRPGRNVEMAIQRLVSARANGCWWTIETDIENFFPSINRRVLLKDVARRVVDPEVMRLIAAWLDADALTSEREPSGWLKRGHELIAEAQQTVRENIDHTLDDLLAERLRVAGYSTNDYLSAGLPAQEEDEADYANPAKTNTGAVESLSGESRVRRAAVRRLVEDGLLFALSERRTLARLASSKLLGVGGAALGGVALAATVAPLAVRKLRERRSPLVGTLQGAPISPLLANVYLHPFDSLMTKEGRRLIRYCDDFVIPCADEAEARAALKSVERALKSRGLRLHTEKTRIIPPGEAFDFLGYHFQADGRVVPPPTVPHVIARQIVQLAHRAAREASGRATSVADTTEREVKRWSKGLLNTLRRR